MRKRRHHELTCIVLESCLKIHWRREYKNEAITWSWHIIRGFLNVAVFVLLVIMIFFTTHFRIYPWHNFELRPSENNLETFWLTRVIVDLKKTCRNVLCQEKLKVQSSIANFSRIRMVSWTKHHWCMSFSNFQSIFRWN